MLLRALRWGLAGALVAWTLIRLLGLERGWPLVPLLAFTPWVAAFALLVAIAGRRAAVAGVRARPAAPAGLVLAVAIAPRVIPNRAPEDAPGVRLRVLAANVARRPRRRLPASARSCARYRVDVVSVLELPPEVVRAYELAGLSDLLPHQVLEPRPGVQRDRAVLADPAARRAGAGRHTLRRSRAASAAPEGAAPLELYAVHVRGAHLTCADGPVAR